MSRYQTQTENNAYFYFIFEKIELFYQVLNPIGWRGGNWRQTDWMASSFDHNYYSFDDSARVNMSHPRNMYVD